MAQVPFTKCVVIYNQKSTRARTALQRAKRLQSFFDKPGAWRLVRITPGRDADNQAALQSCLRHLSSRTLLCIAAGDGTVNWVVNSLLNDPNLPDRARRASILPLWGGNANDLAYMCNGSAARSDVVKIINQGKPVPVRPLVCSLQGPNLEMRRLACCYISFGASALAAQSLNAQEHRNRPGERFPGKRLFREVWVVMRAMLHSPRFTIVEDNKERTIYERMVLNGPRFAKVERAALKLTDAKFYQTTVERKKLSAILFHLRELGSRRLSERVSATQLDFLTASAIYVQLDGESMRVPTGTYIRIEQSATPIYIVSLRLIDS